VYGDADGALAISNTRAHSGTYSVLLVNPSSGADEGPGLYRDITADHAYFSVWYYLPQAYETVTSWAIQSYGSVLEGDPPVIAAGIDLRIRRLPGGEIVLYVFSHDQDFLQAPLADPPPFVPVGRWFQIETELDTQGSFNVWLDGELAYALRDWPVPNAHKRFTPCSVGQTIQPSPVELFVDDVAVSVTRVTPNGVLEFE
jgi:hypothetical protein